MHLISNIKSNHPDHINVVLKSFHYLRVNTREGLHIIPIVDILYIQSYSNYAMFHLKGGLQITASKTLKSIEVQLKGHPFIRCHQSYLVNVKEIRLLEHHALQLTDQESIPVSKSRREDIIKNLETISLSI